MATATTCMETMLDRMMRIARLWYAADAQAGSTTGWNGTGDGIVRVEQPEQRVVLFHETGIDPLQLDNKRAGDRRTNRLCV